MWYEVCVYSFLVAYLIDSAPFSAKTLCSPIYQYSSMLAFHKAGYCWCVDIFLDFILFHWLFFLFLDQHYAVLIILALKYIFVSGHESPLFLLKLVWALGPVHFHM